MMADSERKGGVIECAANVDQRGCEQRHANRDVNGMPESQHVTGVGNCRGLRPAQRGIRLDAIGSAGDAGIDITANKSADDHNQSHQRHRPGQSVELPGCVQENHVRPHETGKNVEFKPFRHLAPARLA